MVPIEIKPFVLVGISIKTTNKDGRSNIDCGNLWQKFEMENYADRIPGKQNDKVFAVYYEYEGDHTQPFSYFIGCSVQQHIDVPTEMKALLVPGGSYQLFKATGKMPDCVANTWKAIWNANIERSFQYDFEVYDERSLDWNTAEVDIYISTK